MLACQQLWNQPILSGAGNDDGGIENQTEQSVPWADYVDNHAARWHPTRRVLYLLLPPLTLWIEHFRCAYLHKQPASTRHLYPNVTEFDCHMWSVMNQEISSSSLYIWSYSYSFRIARCLMSKMSN